MEFKLKEDRQLEPSELIFESKRLVALGRLYHSLVSFREEYWCIALPVSKYFPLQKWFVREIWELRTPGDANGPDTKPAKLQFGEVTKVIPTSWTVMILIGEK